MESQWGQEEKELEDALEPRAMACKEGKYVGEQDTRTSIAVSLKRIADALEQSDAAGRIADAIYSTATRN